MIRQETNAKQRDRLRAIELAVAGHTAPEIARMLGRSRRFVQDWCYVYRDHGLEAIGPRRQTGAPTKLSVEQHESFKQRILHGPTDHDGVCTLRGRDIQRILEQEYGVSYSLSGVYERLHAMGLSVLVPRPRHRDNDPQAMQEWVERAPLLSRKSETRTPTNASKCGSRTKRGSGNKAH